MIILLTGDNIYEIDQELGRIIDAHTGEAEVLGADSVTPASLTDIFMGVSLFSQERLVVLRHASSNSALWEALGPWLERDTATTLVLVEPRLDKRTKIYKQFVAQADVRSFTAWGERDTAVAEKWLQTEAKRRSVVLDPQAAREIVRRRGVEQYQLINTLEQLVVFETITASVVVEHLEEVPQENVFALLAAGVAGDTKKVHSMIETLKLTNDPYMTMGLLASQVVALSGLVLASGADDVAKDLGVSPYVLRNLQTSARGMDRQKLRAVVQALGAADIGLKTSTVDPWVQIEAALVRM